MRTPLPSKNKQRKLAFKPSKQFAIEIYELLNIHIFDGVLVTPSINFRSIRSFGVCHCYTEEESEKRFCKIKLTRGFHCVQWFVMILAHEMVHQHEWLIDGVDDEAIMNHESTFEKFTEKMEAFGIPLRITYDSKLWLQTQMDF